MLYTKEKLTKAAVKSFDNYKTKRALTFNTFTKDAIKFDAQIEKVIHYVNQHLYGKNYKKNQKRLLVVAGEEYGYSNGGLHGHFAIAHNDNFKRP